MIYCRIFAFALLLQVDRPLELFNRGIGQLSWILDEKVVTLVAIVSFPHFQACHCHACKAWGLINIERQCAVLFLLFFIVR